MKLLYLHEFPVPSRAANGVHVAKMCSAFVEQGHDVVLCVPRAAGGAVVSSDAVKEYYGLRHSFAIEQVPSAFWGGRPFRYAWNALRFARRYRPDVVYGRSITACTLAVCTGWKTVFEGHHIITGRLQRLIFATLCRSRHLSHVVVISEALKEIYVKRYAFSPDRVWVAPDGSDPHNSASSLARAETGNDAIVVGYAGSLGSAESGRGIDLIVALSERFPEVPFHVYGGSPGQAGHWSNKTRNKNIHFHGYIEPHELPAALAECDILLAPYQRSVIVGGGGDTSAWMSPLKVFEYMAAGKAILCSDMTALREVLEHEKTALLAPPDDREAWSRALQRLQQDAALRARLGAAAKQEFEANYTWTKRAQRVLEPLFPSSLYDGR